MARAAYAWTIRLLQNRLGHRYGQTYPNSAQPQMRGAILIVTDDASLARQLIPMRQGGYYAEARASKRTAVECKAYGVP